jgi:hypothetical protein
MIKFILFNSTNQENNSMLRSIGDCTIDFTNDWLLDLFCSLVHQQAGIYNSYLFFTEILYR